MLSLSVAAAVISLLIVFVAQILYSARVVRADTRNLCLTACGVWLTVAVVVYCVGLLIMAGGL